MTIEFAKGIMSLTVTSSKSFLRAFWSRLRKVLFAPVDIASLVYFRIAFGAIMFWEVWRYFNTDRIGRYWIEPEFHFTYYGFSWIKPWPGDGMYTHFYALGILSMFIILGLWYRVSATLFFLGFTYMFLLDQARYLNHFYLICLISFLMIFVPAHHSLSTDAKLRPSIRSNVAPTWALWLLRFQMGVVYFYGGLAKINWDWLRGEPMRDWLAKRTDYPVAGQFFDKEPAVYFFSYGGLLFDLLIVPFLLWRKTRPFAFIAAIFFNLMNMWLFDIGAFPWLALGATALFFSPDWPRRLIGWVGEKTKFKRLKPDQQPLEPADIVIGQRSQTAIMVLICLYAAVQCLAPFRHFLYPGNVSWTEEGHRFSWHMKLRDKDATASFTVRDPATNREWTISPNAHLARWQVSEMESRPDMILQFSHYLARLKRKEGYENVQVFAKVLASLNGRPHQLLIDPTVNLAAQQRTIKPKPWILPLKEEEPAQNADANSGR